MGDASSNQTLNEVAASNKVNVSFFNVASLEGQAEGSLLLINNGQVTATLAAGGNISSFVSENA